jgi:electron transport complex protein RnfB
METDLYRKLQRQLDQYSMGFPATESGVEIKILKKLFSEADARLFLQMTPLLEAPADIAARLDNPVDEITTKLEDLAARGLLFRLTKGETVKYGAIPFVHGLYEFQVNKVDRALAALVRQYFKEGFGKALNASADGFLRTIPVQQSLSVTHNIAPYEDAARILEKNAAKIVVTDCICRKSAGLVDEGCGKPLEVCFMFGSMGQYYLDHSMGRRIELEEALNLLTKAREAGLVTQPASSQNPAGMCNCCGDCCGPLSALNRHPKPAKIVFSNYFAQVDEKTCTGCGLCEERCQMGAIAFTADDVAGIDLDRCIGCGLCVTTCPEEALSLVKKPEKQVKAPPANAFEQMMQMAQKRGIL